MDVEHVAVDHDVDEAGGPQLGDDRRGGHFFRKVDLLANAVVPLALG